MIKNILAFTILLLIASPTLFAEVIHQERSLYRNIFVEDSGDLRCLKFSVKRETSNQSCIYKSDPNKMVFTYTKLAFSGLLLKPNPKRILIVGLGGGTLSNTFHQLFPEAIIDNVEIDPAVVKVAKQYFDFKENQQVTNYEKDGRIFIKRAVLKKQQYDWIILDAYNGDYIPEHLMTKEFLAETKKLLSPTGVMTANTFSLSQLYNAESATYQAVFGEFYNVRFNEHGNRIIAYTNGTKPTQAELESRADQLAPVLIKYGVDIYRVLRSMKIEQDWPKNTRILTDQYSPANLLK
ncbi:spermidine synthase [Thalassotalea eurytherma]|uniref:Polyamine aminopropyltransferase n=1 Tax=Thalassotalea eurytherma TaxID=1144278 RepID=A0ABQ6H6C2_9GAMM|nr:fused MFS/spermidine synthase [Thalassotalea eurytherma]GLX83034.1 polyamine aminopropyltransferase [Thalassotalea eurytherma]